MKVRIDPLVFVIFVPLCLAQTSGQTTSPGVDLKAIDRAADPCQDFYQYACGSWIKQNPIPADEGSWSRFDELNERIQTNLRQILEDSHKGSGANGIRRGGRR
jgi:putative endopeptidase